MCRFEFLVFGSLGVYTVFVKPRFGYFNAQRGDYNDQIVFDSIITPYAKRPSHA